MTNNHDHAADPKAHAHATGRATSLGTEHVPPSYDEALEDVVRQARAAVESWTYLRDVKVSTFGEALSPAGALVELGNAMFHLEGHLENLDNATPAPGEGAAG